jgi:periplasmic divalent cation tolerance protein
VIVLTTLGAQTDAAAFARVLVDERLAACVNILPPMTSVYRWKEAIEEEREQQLVIKTTSDRVAALEARFHELHPYELPEFLVVAATDWSAGYLEWLVNPHVKSFRIVRLKAFVSFVVTSFNVQRDLKVRLGDRGVGRSKGIERIRTSERFADRTPTWSTVTGT